jgi:hypothetical protein
MLVAVAHCDRAIEKAEQAGNVDQKASALNARALILHDLAGRPEWILESAEKSLEGALALNARIGDPRACFQNLRNLGLVHRKWASLYQGDDKIARLRKASIACQIGESYLKQILEERTRGEVREARYRHAEVLIEMGELQVAASMLSGLCSEWQNEGDWHREARCLQLLLKAGDPEQCRQGVERLCSIYQQALSSSQGQESFRQYKIRLKNARDILADARVTAERYSRPDLVVRVNEHLAGVRQLAQTFGWPDLIAEANALLKA